MVAEPPPRRAGKTASCAGNESWIKDNRVFFKTIVFPLPTGTEWMNWCMFGACAGCIPILLGFRENYRRLNIDKEDTSKGSNEQETDSKRLNSPIGSILSFTHVDELVHRLKKAKESSI